jgi:kynureninase
MPKPEQIRNPKVAEAAFNHLAYTSATLSEALLLVQTRTRSLEEALKRAAGSGVSYDLARAVTEDLDGILVEVMIRAAYEGLYDTAGADTVMWCLAHKRKVRWIPWPGWWIHDDDLPRVGGRNDSRGCRALLNADAPITVTRKAAS